MSLWNKIKYSNLNSFRTRCSKPLIFQTQIIWANRIHSLKYLRSATFGSKNIVIRKSEFVAKTQFLWNIQCFYATILQKVCKKVLTIMWTYCSEDLCQIVKFPLYLEKMLLSGLPVSLRQWANPSQPWRSQLDMVGATF